MTKGKPHGEMTRYIATIEDLHVHLQAAVELEHSTIPPYLTALYSIRPGYNAAAAKIIHSVVIEEMLHMLLAANLLNAVGGAPSIDHASFVPCYPAHLPVGHSGPVLVDIRRFSPEAIATFLAIERPAARERDGSGPPIWTRPPVPGEFRELLRKGALYRSIGEFYEAIQSAMTRLEAEAQGAGRTIFTGLSERQVTSSFAYHDGGEVMAVTDLGSAIKALTEIVDQGEGYNDTMDDGDAALGQPAELAHYYRFNQIHRARQYVETDTPSSGPTGAAIAVNYGAEAVYQMAPNPSPAMYEGDRTVQAQCRAFSGSYTDLLRKLHAACNGQPHTLDAAVGAMFQLKTLAIDLMQTRTPDGAGDAGPCFAYAPEDQDRR